MAVVSPAILASDSADYHQQIKNVAHFAKRIHIDLSDGRFAPHPTIVAEQAWWPVGVKADFHLMYKEPLKVVSELLSHQPNLIIVHAEAEGDFAAFASQCHQKGVKVGVALLPPTSAEIITPAIGIIDHVLIFSGQLGTFGGQADLNLLQKARQLKKSKPGLEIGWDGGINEHNAHQLVSGGVDVLYSGGFIQQADNPQTAYIQLQRLTS